VSPTHPLAKGKERVSIADLGEELFVAHNVTFAAAAQGD
jgi:hypothetical protein